MQASEFFARYSSGTYTLKDVFGELLELTEAVAKRDWREAREEAWDVALFTQGWLYTRGLDFRVRASLAHWAKFERRRRAWVAIFQAAGLEFKGRYLVGGSNHKKPAKVAMALAMARAEQGLQRG